MVSKAVEATQGGLSENESIRAPRLIFRISVLTCYRNPNPANKINA